MTKKREKFLIDLMDDTDSDDSEIIKPKAWKRLRKGKHKMNSSKRFWTDDHFVDERQDENVG
jgi:hypothetical protein